MGRLVITRCFVGQDRILYIAGPGWVMEYRVAISVADSVHFLAVSSDGATFADVDVVRPRNSEPYLRTRPDMAAANNLGAIAVPLPPPPPPRIRTRAVLPNRPYGFAGAMAKVFPER